jgi:hypothetical protein
MKNVYLLPTEKPSRLGYLTKKGKEVFKDLRLFDKPMPNILDSENQHIYITSDEEIKDVRPYKGKWQLEQGEILNKFPTYLTDLSECKLVIMTTDQDLIADGVQAIDDEFLEWFVNNPSCESVEVKPLLSNNGRAFYGYRIVIPQEDPNQELLPDFKITKNIFDFVTDLSDTNKEEPKQECTCGICDNCEEQETIQILKEAKENALKQETIEEAAANLADPNICKTDNWIAGAKYITETMYTEDEVIRIARDAYAMGRNIVLVGAFNKWLEKFKKK